LFDSCLLDRTFVVFALLGSDSDSLLTGFGFDDYSVDVGAADLNVGCGCCCKIRPVWLRVRRVWLRGLMMRDGVSPGFVGD
jgi:hypothetical protein